MTEETEDNRDYEVCLRCAEPNPEGTSRCQNCGGPLDPSASTHPWEMKTANHKAYSAPASPRTKPIIFWGVWVYFGPSALFAILLVYDFVRGHLQDDLFYELNLDTFMGLFLPVAYGILSFWALWSVTKGYFGKRTKN